MMTASDEPKKQLKKKQLGSLPRSPFTPQNPLPTQPSLIKGPEPESPYLHRVPLSTEVSFFDIQVEGENAEQEVYDEMKKNQEISITEEEAQKKNQEKKHKTGE